MPDGSLRSHVKKFRKLAIKKCPDEIVLMKICPDEIGHINSAVKIDFNSFFPRSGSVHKIKWILHPNVQVIMVGQIHSHLSDHMKVKDQGSQQS